MAERAADEFKRRGNSLVEMIKGRAREFLREPSAFFFVLFMPLIWMGILGHAFDGRARETYGVGWPSGAPHAEVAERVHAALAASPQLHVVEGSPEVLQTALQRGEILLMVEPPAAAGGTWIYAFDPASREALRARSIVQDVAEQGAGRRDVLSASDQPMTIPGTRYIDFLVPGLVAFSIMTSSLFGTGAVIVVNRRENLLKRYKVTPMRPGEYIASHIIGRFIILAVELASILGGGWAFFNFHMAGSWLDFIALAMLGAAVFTALAIFCASRTANMAVMNGLTNLVTLPMMIVAGVWFSRTNLPAWMASAARYLPLTALVNGLRRIALEGASLAMLGPELLILALYLVVGAIAARLLFKWY